MLIRRGPAGAGRLESACLLRGDDGNREPTEADRTEWQEAQVSKLCGQAGLLYPRSLLFTQSGLWVWGRTRLRKEGPDLQGCFRFRGPPKLGQCQEGYVGSEPRAPSKLKLPS